MRYLLVLVITAYLLSNGHGEHAKADSSLARGYSGCSDGCACESCPRGHPCCPERLACGVPQPHSMDQDIDGPRFVGLESSVEAPARLRKQTDPPPLDLARFSAVLLI